MLQTSEERHCDGIRNKHEDCDNFSIIIHVLAQGHSILYIGIVGMWILLEERELEFLVLLLHLDLAI